MNKGDQIWSFIFGAFVSCVITAFFMVWLFNNHFKSYSDPIKYDLASKKHAEWVVGKNGKPVWKLIEVAPKE